MMPLSAFPTSAEIYGGLTKRELFAAMAMQGMLGQPDDVDDEWPEGVATFEEILHHQSNVAVQYADALIKELAKEV
jgi:hypothetical protein